MRGYSCILGAVVVGMIFHDVQSAPEKPNFAGEWKSESSDSSSGWGQQLTVTQDASILSIEYEFFASDDRQPPLKFDYDLSGKVTTNSVMMGRGIQTETSTTTWSGDRLVVTTVYPSTDPVDGKSRSVEVQRILWLESPSTLIVEKIRAGVMGGPAATSRTTYTRLERRSANCSAHTGPAHPAAHSERSPSRS